MRRWPVCVALIGLTSVTNALDNFTMTVSPPPVPGKPFTITWSPDTSGEVVILLNNFIDQSLDIITFADTLAVLSSDSGTYVWDVPYSLCGRFSFSIAADRINRYNYGQIWSIPCPSTSASIIQTTACSSSIPSPTGANTFLLPNADNYPVRVGKEINILWNPTTSGTVSVRAYSSSSTKTTTIADKISNSGTFAWTPPSDLSGSSSTSTAGSGYTLEIVDDASQKITSTSPSINVLLPTYETVFVNVNDWIYPIVGKAVNIQWSASNASTISIQVTSGMVPDASNSVYIATNVPNNGSFMWNVSPTFTPGQYTVIAATPGNLFDDLQVIVISTTAISPCSPLGSSALLSNTRPTDAATSFSPTFATTTAATSSEISSSTAIDSSGSALAAFAALLTLNYTQILQITCVNSILLSYTSFISSGTTTSFPTAGCSSPVSPSATPSNLGCHSGFSTFSIASNSSVCCPSAWQTSSLDVMYCFTSAPAASSGAVAARTVQGSSTSTMSQASVSPTVIVISNIVFTRAGTVTSKSSSLPHVLSSVAAFIAMFVGLVPYFL